MILMTSPVPGTIPGPTGLLSATAWPEALCSCGGLLGSTLHGWIHTDACPSCWTAADRWTTCTRPETHGYCLIADPLLCDHLGCRAAARIDAHPCASDRDLCCGCCHH